MQDWDVEYANRALDDATAQCESNEEAMAAMISLDEKKQDGENLESIALHEVLELLLIKQKMVIRFKKVKQESSKTSGWHIGFFVAG
jgi:hypothetical protein